MGRKPLPTDLDGLSPEVRTLIQELRVHQDELEEQNRELHEIQVSLDISRAQYFRLYDLAPVGFVTIGGDERLQEANHTAAALLGTSKDQLIGRPLSRFIVANDQDTHYLRRRELRSTGTHQTYELRMKRANGSRFWAQLQETMVADDDLKEPVLWATISDISELKEAEREQRALVAQKLEGLRLLERSEQHMRALLDACFDEAVLVEGDGTILAANLRLARHVDMPQDQILGRNAFELMPSQVADTRRAWFQEAIETRGPITHEDQVQGRCFETTIHPLLDEEGEIDRLAINTRDITETRRTFDELQRMVALAETASRTKSEFLANMSHEIRTPLNGVIGITALLLGEELGPEVADMVATIQRSGYSLMAIINDILDFSKIEAGQLEIEAIPFDLHTPVQDVLNEFAIQASDKGLELIAIVEHEAPSLLIGDPGRLGQVLNNLLSNAIKFTARGHVLLRVSVEGGDAESATLRFEVTDTGIGIAADRQPTLFDAFTQADASTTRRFGGTGLGLSIAKKLVQLMGGDIGMTSRAGHGSTFWFMARFPVFSHDRSAPILAPGAAAARVLLVDDQPVALEALSLLLESFGIRHTTAQSGATALDMLRAAEVAEDRFDVAIVDHDMPGMNGSELVRAIAAEPAIRDTSVLMMSSLGSRTRPGNAIRVECAGRLTKPVLAESLRQALNTCWPWDAHPQPAGSANPLPRIEPSEPRPVPGANTRMLVVEDNPVNQRVAAKLLERLGCHVELAGNGLEALELYERGSYDLIFMDCQMPEMDGYAATRAIRGQSRDRYVPIIAMTAHAMQGDREKCLAAGMDDYLTKPVSPRHLKRMVERWLSEAEVGESGAVAGPREANLPRAVLVVEDSMTQRIALCNFLLQDGYTVIEARDGAEGLARARAQRFDAVVVDRHMPVMNGLEMVAAIRALEGYGKTPIVLLTQDPPEEEWQELGIDSWLRKSRDLRALRTLLERWLG